MIAAHPVFGIGLGEFYRRTAEFSSPDLIAKFPVVARGENAHNNFLQVAAELGIAGGFLFVWLIVAALVTAARRPGKVEGDQSPRDSRDLWLHAPRLLLISGLAAFAVSMLGGHPLLIAEPGLVFWTLLGAAAGSAAEPGVPHGRLRWLVPFGLITITLSVPWQLRTAREDASFEHQAFGVSQWQYASDGTRYREAPGPATLFVPTGAFSFNVYPIAEQPVRLELKLDGRIADVVLLAPRRWNHIRQPARTEAIKARFGRLEVRVLDSDRTPIWITKVEPLQ
jgi:hypothetical protein